MARASPATSRSARALDDVGEVFLAKYEKRPGWHYYSREDLGLPRGEIPARDRVNRATGAIDPMKPSQH